MGTFVLVPGAWLGGWAWKDVRELLRARGHEVHTPSLTGLGERAHLGGPDVDLDTHVADVVNLIAFEGLTGVTLVGHSYAGLVVQVVADRIPERLDRVVWLDSAPLPDGMSMRDFGPPGARDRMDRRVERDGQGWRLPPPPFDELGGLSALDGLGPEHRALFGDRAVAQPYGTYRQAVRDSHVRDRSYERVLVLCGGFGISLEQLRTTIASGNPMFGALAAPDWRFERLATGHWPMWSAPVELAALLDRLAGRCYGPS